MPRPQITNSAYERFIYRKLKQQKRRAARANDDEKVAKLEFILDDEDAFAMTVEQIIAKADLPEDDLKVVFYGDSKAFPLLDALAQLLRWFTDNIPSIMSIISVIIGLFAKQGNEAAQALAPPED